MSRSSTICVDANLVVRRVIEPEDLVVEQHWNEWLEQGHPIVAPALLHYEVVNALRRISRAGERSPAAVRNALRTALIMPISVYDDDALHVRAFELAEQFGLPATYDAHYLALAERLGIEFYTGDRRLWNTVRHQLPWVRLVEVDSAETPGTTR